MELGARRPAVLMVGPILKCSVGETEYMFRRALFGDYSQDQTTFTMRGLRRFGAGRGKSREEAFKNWSYQFHLTYQRLLEKNIDDMSSREKLAFTEAEDVVDVESMKQKRAITLRQIGVITQIRQGGFTFRWEDGTRDTVPLDILPEDCASFMRGQRVEAIVRRVESSFAVLRILHTQALPDAPLLTDEEADDLWNTLPGASTRPEASWD